MKIDRVGILVYDVVYDATDWGFFRDLEGREAWADLLNKVLTLSVNKSGSSYESARATLDKVYDLIRMTSPDEDLSDVEQFGASLLKKIYYGE